MLVIEVANDDENVIVVEGVVGHRVEDEKLHCLGRHDEMILLFGFDMNSIPGNTAI